MPTALSVDLRVRVLAAVAQGLTHRQRGSAAHTATKAAAPETMRPASTT
jgi:hypothetical protein